MAHERLANPEHDCPKVSYFMAKKVNLFNDATAFQIIVNNALRCAYAGDPLMMRQAESLAKSAIVQEMSLGQADNSFVYDRVQAVLQRLAGMPGERAMVLVSPGFSLSVDSSRLWRIVDQANRSKIMINTLDARGLYTTAMYHGSSSDMPTPEAMNYLSDEQLDQSVVLADFADGTGGTHFHNSNDIAGGMEQLADAPAVTYILVFSPQNQKMDGSFHTLKVDLTGNQKYDIKARAGYYAPKKDEHQQEQTRADIQQIVYSREEVADMPMELRTEYFKKAAGDAELTVMTRLTVNDLQFQKLDGRSCNKLTVITAIFDANGNYVSGEKKLVNLTLAEAGYAQVMNSGLVLKANFDLKPGRYMVRQVIRETEGSQTSARSGAVEILN